MLPILKENDHINWNDYTNRTTKPTEEEFCLPENRWYRVNQMNRVERVFESKATIRNAWGNGVMCVFGDGTYYFYMTDWDSSG